MKVVTLKTEPRDPKGKGGARRARRAGQLPGVVYGEGRPPRHVAVGMREFVRAVEHGARVLDLDLEGVGASRVLLKDLQYDALGRRMVHADFLRLHPEHELTIGIPLDLIGTPKGIADGGILTVLREVVQIRCLPTHIPEKIEVQMAPLGLGESLHPRDVELPPNVALAEDPDDVLLTISVPRGIETDEDADEAAADEAGAAAAG